MIFAVELLALSFCCAVLSLCIRAAPGLKSVCEN